SENLATSQYAERVFLRLEEFSLKREAELIRKQVERLNPVTAPDDHQQLFQRYVALERRRRELRAAAEGAGGAGLAPASEGGGLAAKTFSRAVAHSERTAPNRPPVDTMTTGPPPARRSGWRPRGGSSLRCPS